MSKENTPNPSIEKIHFIWKCEDQKVSAFAKSLIDEVGQTPFRHSTMLVSIGGDGKLLEAFRKAGKRKVYGITMPDSGSEGFWTDHGVKNGKDLLERIANAEEFLLSPLKATIRFSKGSTQQIFGYNEITAKSDSGQAAIMNLIIKLKKNQKGPLQLKGDGLNISTAFGSTGTNLTLNGPAVTIPNRVAILAGINIYRPRGISPVVINNDEASFHINFDVQGSKRPVRIDYDGKSVYGSRAKGEIVGLDVTGQSGRTVRCMMQSDPGLRAITALMMH